MSDAFLNIHGIVNSLREKFGNHFIAMALFGSLARDNEKEFNDVDIFLIINGVSNHQLERRREVAEAIEGCCVYRLSLLILTQNEFENNFASIYLDLGLDAKILYDTDDYLANKLQRIRHIIQDAGLRRIRNGRDFVWDWDLDPAYPWEISWEGLHELVR